MSEPDAEASHGTVLDPPVTMAISSGVATVTMNRPDQRNRLDLEAIRLMQALIERAGADDSVRVVIITGSGSTFCSGADLAAASTSDGFAAGALTALGDLLRAILVCPKPTIARVQGHVAGGGNGLVAACDIAVAADDARFAFSEVRVGVVPAVISVVCLAVMQRRHAQELLLTGERVSAERVREAGLVTCVVPAADLDAVVDGYVRQLCAGGPLALATTKDLIRRVPAMPRDEAFAWTAEVSATAFTSPEAAEGMAAFLARRPPAWAPGDQ
ncbi:MAG: enoyl-CoA hydratase/isomerase family protein [Actinomycetales bacterium]|nr:enoyl-CoA hydratase/isomerase family protein [Actinomycetales bacterium]